MSAFNIKNISALSCIMGIVMQLMIAATTPPNGIITDGNNWPGVWDAGWQLPAIGQGVITFTVAPASGESLHDVNIFFSSVQAIADRDKDNFWVSIAASANTISSVTNGVDSLTSYFYWMLAGRSFQGGINGVASVVPILANATTDVAYDFRITIDAPQSLFLVEARESGIGSYETLFNYRGAVFSFPPNLRYFSFFSAVFNVLTITNIVVSELPVSAPSIVLDGRSSIKYLSSHYTFTDGQSALGYVYFAKGFTVPEGQRAYLDILYPVDGPIDLNGSGKIILKSPLRIGPGSDGFINGGVIETSNGDVGRIVFENDMFLTKQLTFNNSMLLDLGGHFLTLSSSGTNRGSFMIDNTISQTITLRNGVVRGIEDFSTGFPPRLCGSIPIGGRRHRYACSNVDLYLTSEGTVTMTSVDLSCIAGKNNIFCPRSAKVNHYTGLYIEDAAELLLNDGIKFALNTELSTSYFSIGHGSALSLENATFAYAKPLTFPSPYLSKDIVSSLIVQGASSLQALGGGGDRNLTLGGSVTHDYDPFVDIGPASSLMLDNVVLINNNVLR